MQQPIEKFWMVFGVQRGSPTYRHTSKQAAQMEAKRLAKKHPGEMFIVLAAVDAFKAAVSEPENVRLTKSKPRAEGECVSDDGIPF